MTGERREGEGREKGGREDHSSSLVPHLRKEVKKGGRKGGRE